MNSSHIFEVMLKKYRGIAALQGPGRASSLHFAGNVAKDIWRLYSIVPMVSMVPIDPMLPMFVLVAPSDTPTNNSNTSGAFMVYFPAKGPGHNNKNMKKKKKNKDKQTNCGFQLQGTRKRFNE
eukprot:m.17638 g.17638  ORF g.17638 m.17638 type:complete len:123 (+) comp6070_c0_seq1:354-722(+)